MDSPGTGDSDTTGPRPIVSDDLASSEHEVHTSDVSSTDEDDFQPFALPDEANELADGPLVEYLPLADGDIDLFDDDLLEDDEEGEALIADGGLLLLVDAPAAESPAHSPAPDSFESVASAPSHTLSAQHFSHGSDPDQASSVSPIPSFAFDHDDVEDSDPIFPPGFDPDQDIEFIPMDQPMEDPVDPADPVEPIDPEFDFEMAFDDPEPAMAPEQAAALDPMLEHDPVHVGMPIEPVIADPPVDDHPVDAPLLEGDHVIAADHVDHPLIADAPIHHLVAPPPDPVPLEPEHALFATHMVPRDEHAQHRWIPADDEVPPIPPQITDTRHVDTSFSFPQFTPPARPGEGSSAHPFGHAPTSVPFMPQFPPVIPPVSPFRVAPFDPTSEPFLWSSPPVMPPTDPYHPFHMGHTIEDVLMSFVAQHEAHTQRIQELERAQPPPCQCQGQTHSPLQPSRPVPPDYAARLFALEQQVASFLRTQRAMEEDWLQLRRLFYTHFPHPPPPSV
ncbi:hypothetical protein HanXRQr2_Chr10g0435511 [Helianthus annuus]|uniref:Uncharacterized protein n=1 Tax=Helianthus annuus TaxID=4232 RepID=A0A9K3N425_HELAN|nr:hypothetical protein HanXRQr2_Chr10g0435511 [Helianthus annuus]